MSDPTPSTTDQAAPIVSRRAAFWNALGSVLARLGVYLATHPEVVQAAVNIAVSKGGAR